MKKYLIIGAVVLVVVLGALCFFSNARTAYWKGHSERTLQELERVEKKFEEAIKEDRVTAVGSGEAGPATPS